MTALYTLTSLGACAEALEWVAAQPDQSPAALWATCPRGDWLAWYLGSLGARAGRGSPEHRRAVLIACLCAKTALPHAGQGREEIDALVGHVEAWAHGEAVDFAPLLRRLRESALTATTAAAYAAAYAVAAYAHGPSATYAAAAAAAATWGEARARHLAALADIIRSAAPEAP